MIKLVEDNHSATRQARPEVFETVYDDVIKPGVEKDELELHILMLFKELIEFGTQVQFVNMNEVVELDVSREVPFSGDESPVLEPGHAPADVLRHDNYNKSSLDTAIPPRAASSVGRAPA